MLGYAVEANGKIDMRTVSETPRAAKVNWLYTRAALMVTQDWNDERIDSTFEFYRDQGMAKCVEVVVTKVTGND